MSEIRMILVDDHVVIRSGLRLVLEREPEFRVVGEGADGSDAIRLAEELSPDVAILDIAMPNLNGIEAARQITAKAPKTGVVMLSMHSDEGYVLRALNAGARGYLLKESPEEDLIAAVKAVHRGKAYFSPAISRVLVDDYVRQMRRRGLEDSYELLTAREREILQLLAEGKSNKDVATRLSLSLYTVETHRSNLMEKLNLHGIPELILYAVRKRIIF